MESGPASPPPPSLPEIVCIPMKVDALVLNDSVAGGDPANLESAPNVKVAPITQPNYTFLRLSNNTIQSDDLPHTIQSDVLPHTDLHYTSPAYHNSRLTDLGTGQSRTNRKGVYIAWTLPRAYRMGATGTTTATTSKQRAQQGYQPIDQSGTPDFSAPDFRPVPTRWLVVRCIDKKTLRTPTPVPPDQLNGLLYKAWVIESDLLRYIDDLDITTDLQTDVSPFVITSRDNTMDSVAQQAEAFIGSKCDATQWAENNPSYAPEGSGTDQNSRVALSVLNSSNHLFADFQPHNSNVFSMIDDVSYTDQTGLQKITSATISYQVIGWHSNENENPYHIYEDGPTSLGKRMGALAMALKDPSGQGATAWQQLTVSSDVLCHGTIYDVAWSYNTLPPDPSAEKAAELLKSSQPIAVGTTPTDALLAYIHAHAGIDSGAALELENDIIALQTLLIAQDDGVDPNLQAADQLENLAFERFDGGTLWHLKGSGSEFSQPTLYQQTSLKTLNSTQQAYDNAARTAQKLQWDLFSVWWQYVSGAYISKKTDPQVEQLALVCYNKITILTKYMSTLKSVIDGLSGSLQAEKGSQVAYGQRKDPTLLVGGVQAGWPHDYLDNLLIRLDSQIIEPSEGAPPDPDWSGLPGFANIITRNMPPHLNQAAVKLIQEFSILHPTSADPPASDILPLYHDQLDDPAQWRDRWNGQPWAPLFVEWEAEYFHIPYQDFSLEPRSDGGPQSVLRWGIKSTVDVSCPKIYDQRTISGRILILPQPSFSLANAVGQLIQNMGTKFPLPDEIEFLKNANNFYQLPYLSSTMSGLVSHLTTRIMGTHIKPNQRPRGEVLKPMDAAVDAGNNIGVGHDQLLAIGTESGLTPYGNSVQIPDTNDPPFKPATHGQFRFTKLNVIDKFGRAICAIDPTPRPIKEGLPHIAPCLAELYSCQPLASNPKVPNVVRHDAFLHGVPDSTTPCEFVQLPPTVNQPARINVAYMVPDQPYWRPVTDWESPIYGWLVVNYADYGLQFFLQDGTFYCELRLGGPDGLVTTPAWAPFPPGEVKVPTQLHNLIEALSKLPGENEVSYLQAFFNMINLSFANGAPAPNSYAQFVNSIVGKPLALVNFGVSLELASEPLSNQSVYDYGKQQNTLLPPPSGSKDQTQYTFPIQVGDKIRTYDGLVGYWSHPPSAGNSIDFNYDSVYTYWPSPKCPHTTNIQSDDFPRLAPFFVPPYSIPSSGDPTPYTPTEIENFRNSYWTLFSAVVDPFTPVHIFSGASLPTASLTLPHWTTEAALAKMTAFFHVGPVLLTVDVPKAPNSVASSVTGDPPPPDPNAGKIGLPALTVGQWQWWQPYPPAVKVGDGEDAEKEDAQVGEEASLPVPDLQPQYQKLPLVQVDGRPRFEIAPYTAVEGFLQLVQPIATSTPSSAGNQATVLPVR